MARIGLVSPIRGGSLPETTNTNVPEKSFPHTRGKFTVNAGGTTGRVTFPPYAGEVYRR